MSDSTTHGAIRILGMLQRSKAGRLAIRLLVEAAEVRASNRGERDPGLPREDEIDATRCAKGAVRCAQIALAIDADELAQMESISTSNNLTATNWPTAAQRAMQERAETRRGVAGKILRFPPPRTLREVEPPAAG